MGGHWDFIAPAVQGCCSGVSLAATDCMKPSSVASKLASALPCHHDSANQVSGFFRLGCSLFLVGKPAVNLNNSQSGFVRWCRVTPVV